MRKGQDRTGRSWLGLLGVSSFALLTGCGWFGGGGPPPGSAKLRPGADRQIQASSALPSANGQQYEQGISAADETRGQLPQLGAIVKGTGGQKAQREKADKESAEREAKAREARLEREAAEKEARAKEKESKAEPRSGPATGMPGKPAAAEPGNPDGVTKVTPAPASGPQSDSASPQTTAPFAATPAVATADSMPAVTRAAMTSAPAAPPPPPPPPAPEPPPVAATPAPPPVAATPPPQPAPPPPAVVAAPTRSPIRTRRSCRRPAGLRLA
jgi:hypothetical protein